MTDQSIADRNEALSNAVTALMPHIFAHNQKLVMMTNSPIALALALALSAADLAASISLGERPDLDEAAYVARCDELMTAFVGDMKERARQAVKYYMEELPALQAAQSQESAVA